MRSVVRTLKDARDVTAYLDHCFDAEVAVDFSELWVQVSCVLEEAQGQGMILDADRALVVSRIFSLAALDGALFDGLRTEVARLILGRVDGCTRGFTLVDVAMVKGMVPHLAGLVVKAGILDVASTLVLHDGGRARIKSRASSDAAQAAWRKRKILADRSGDVALYIRRQKALIDSARKELRWARSQPTV